MQNTTKIFLLQDIPSLSFQVFNRFNTRFRKNHIQNEVNIIESINHFEVDKIKNKRALISLSPTAWLRAKNEAPTIKMFNYTGFVYEMVKVLNECGYLVDIVDFQNEYLPKKDYNIFIGHGDKCRTIIDNLPVNTKIVQYVSGAHWKSFNKESEERYNYFKKRKKIHEQLAFKRIIKSTDNEEYLTEKSDIIMMANCPKVAKSFNKYKNKFFYTNWAAYIDQLLITNLIEKDYSLGMTNFLYVGGGGGNIQKGLDILLETFYCNPTLNLYIYCKVEDQILKYCKTELNASNIHYIYHWRFPPFQDKLRSLINKINFTIHAPINTGIGTAFIGSLGVGLIPVGYIDIEDKHEFCVLSDQWDIESLSNCILEASKKSPEWCKSASNMAINVYNSNWSVESFQIRFRELIKLIGSAIF